jgi:hypothetical protein
MRVSREDRVEDGVGDLIRDFVGMAFSYRFGSEKMAARHEGGGVGGRKFVRYFGYGTIDVHREHA